MLAALGVPFSQFSCYGVSLHLFMAEVRGQGAEQRSRHAEDEENDDGWTAALAVAPVALALAGAVMAISPGWSLL